MDTNIEVGLLIAVATLAVSILMLLSRNSGRRGAEIARATKDAEEEGAQKERIKFLEQQIQRHLEAASTLTQDFQEIRALATTTASTVSHLGDVVGRLVKSVDEQNQIFRDITNAVLREGLVLQPRISLRSLEPKE